MTLMRYSIGLCTSLAWMLITGGARAQDDRVDFDRDVRPILSDVCYKCHGPDEEQRATNLRLDTKAGAFADLDGVRAVVPGDLQRSDLFRRITSIDVDVRMPPADSGRSLTLEQIDILRRWIEQGAAWKQHWSFVPPTQPPLPSVKRSAWVRNGIDHFILARLEREGLAPSPEASKETLIRRATLDLTGLPPTPEEIDAFLADDSPNAYKRVIDRLLASPRYGEWMVLPWLDVARYSDSNGYQTDGTRPMWPWRDGVIAALNANQPFDRFTIEQMAGDMLPDATVEQLVASGFNRNHMLNGEGGRIAEESRVEYVVDRVETTAAAWLGLTAGCGRCHDHKYDPLSQREFYALYAYFNNIDETGAVDVGRKLAKPVIELPTPEQIARRSNLNEKIADSKHRLAELDMKIVAEQADWERQALSDGRKLPGRVRSALEVPTSNRNDEQRKTVRQFYLLQFPERTELEEQIEQARKQLDQLNKSVLQTMVMRERNKQRETKVLVRGQYNQPGEKVDAGIPAGLPPLPEDAPNNRLGFARWLVDRANPLTARVTVNRYWQQFFDTGLVKTAEDFGTQGERPSHPELLDWLSVEFMRDWDVKRMHRLIVASATYRQSSRVTPQLLRRDPENRLLGRGARIRLPSFAVRDQSLALAGLLVERIGGPPVMPYQPEGIWADFSFGKIVYEQDHGEKLYRRSLYTFWRRSVGPTNMFDTSPRQVCTVRPVRTNTPLHSLVTFNDITYVEAARMFAERIMAEAGDTIEDRLAWAFRAATGRPPNREEANVLHNAFARLTEQYQGDREAALKLLQTGESPRNDHLDAVDHAAYTGVAGLLLNLDEVLTKE